MGNSQEKFPCANMWRDSGWKGYDPSAPAYDAEQVRREREAYRP